MCWFAHKHNAHRIEYASRGHPITQMHSSSQIISVFGDCLFVCLFACVSVEWSSMLIIFKAFHQTKWMASGLRVSSMSDRKVHPQILYTKWISLVGNYKFSSFARFIQIVLNGIFISLKIYTHHTSEILICYVCAISLLLLLLLLTNNLFNSLYM